MDNDINTGCPSCATAGNRAADDGPRDTRLSHWPIQIRLIGTVAPFLNNADLLVAADCTAFAVSDFQGRFLGDRKLLIGCPKLDDARFYVNKFTEIFTGIPIKSITCLRMEVPCCGGMTAILKEALKASGKEIPFREIVLGIKGDVIGERDVA
ncbi:MAG: hypothetical protein GXO94_02765 [Nitrospirae bacterium]|nr:hypothetical protein [Nitrospirota bacterium]